MHLARKEAKRYSVQDISFLSVVFEKLICETKVEKEKPCGMHRALFYRSNCVKSIFRSSKMPDGIMSENPYRFISPVSK